MPVDWFQVIIDCNRAGMTCTQISVECQVSIQTICNWRDGYTEPSYSNGTQLLEIHRSVLRSDS